MSRYSTVSSVRPARQLRRLYRYAVVLVLVSAGILALILLYADSKISISDKLTQIGTGLAASIIFAIIYTVLANKEFAELIKTEIAGQLTDHINIIMQQINQINQLFLPTDQYPATRDFDPRFNRAVTRDLCRSNSYFFRGTSAKFIPARLSICRHHIELTQVILLDPRDRSALEARAQDRRRRPEHEGKQIAEIAAEMRNEILLAIIALFDIREHCEIEIGISNITSPVRIEVFDEAMYTSFYKTMESQQNTHPETARFNKESQVYQIFKDECRRQMQLATPRRRFTTRDNDDVLLGYLDMLKFTEVRADNLNKYREAYQTFIKPFSNALTTIGVSE